MTNYDVWKDLGYMRTFKTLEEAHKYIEHSKNIDKKFSIEFVYRIFQNTYKNLGNQTYELVKFKEI